MIKYDETKTPAVIEALEKTRAIWLRYVKDPELFGKGHSCPLCILDEDFAIEQQKLDYPECTQDELECMELTQCIHCPLYHYQDELSCTYSEDGGLFGQFACNTGMPEAQKTAAKKMVEAVDYMLAKVQAGEAIETHTDFKAEYP